MIKASLQIGVLFVLQSSLMAQTPVQSLTGLVPPVVPQLRATGRLAATNVLYLSIGLPLRNRGDLTNLMQRLYDPASPDFRHYLTPEQFAERFGPAEEDYLAVSNFALANGLSVTGTHPNRTLLDVNGSVAAVERTFHVQLHTYQHPTEQRTFFAPDTEPSLSLAVPVLHVSGLDNYSLPRPRVKVLAAGHPQAAQPNVGSGPAPYYGYMGNDFRTAYAPDTTLDGSGQTVGLLQFDGYTASDIAYYENLAGRPNVTLTNVLLDGFTGIPTGSGGEVEVSLDIEMVISMAPAISKVIVYEGGPYGNWHDVLNRMATDNLARQLSCSWYIPGGASDPVADGIFQQMAAQGQSFFSASGDYDAFTGLIPFPGDTPYITEVGGTMLTTATAGGPYGSESAWNRDNGIGTGGGISTQYPIPNWQTGISMTANGGSTTMRNIPDVAMTAEQVYVRCDGEDQDVGGTSCAAPLWAGFAALINQQAAATGKPAVGFLNPAIYAIGEGAGYTAAFHDTVTGNNTSAESPTRFYAVPGYDLTTGWGSPTGQALINALVNPDPLVATPTTGFASSGGIGGPFNITFQTFTLTNAGSNSFSWSMASTTPWLTVTPTSGTLSPGGASAAVTATLNSSASNLVAGTYTATVWFTNLATAVAEGRTFTLSVLGPPVITSQPVNQQAFAGGSVSFSVATTGLTPQTYQWRFNTSSNIPNANSATLSLTGVTAGQAGSYSVVVGNSLGSATSANAVLTVVSSVSGSNVVFVDSSLGDPWGYDDDEIAMTSVFESNWQAAYYETASPAALFSPSNNFIFMEGGDIDAIPMATFLNANLALVQGWVNAGGSLFLNAAPNEGGNIDFGFGVTLNYGTNFTPVAEAVDPTHPIFNGPFLPVGSNWTGNYFGHATITGDGLTPLIENSTNLQEVVLAEAWEGAGHVLFGGMTLPSFHTPQPQGDNLLANIIYYGATINPGPGVPPTITSQPTGITVPVGNNATFTVTVHGTGPLSYFWSRNGVAIPGANASSYTLADVQEADSGSEFSCVITNVVGSVTSAAARLKVDNSVFNDQCSGAMVISGMTYSNAQYTTNATSFGDPEPDCVPDFGNGVWYQFTPPLNGQLEVDTFGSDFDTGLGLYAGSCGSLTEVACNDDTDGMTSQIITPVSEGVSYYILAGGYSGYTGHLLLHLVLQAPPVIVTQPASQNLPVGNTATFCVGATGSAPLNYFWMRNGALIPGATNACYSLANVQSSDSGSQFSCLISNAYGSASSLAASLTVFTPASAVAVYGSPGFTNWNSDVTSNISNTMVFSQVSGFLAGSGQPTPTLAELQQYSAVMVYTDQPFNDPVGMGNVLADYADAGGGVVVATFGFNFPSYGLAGRLVTDGYLPMTIGNQTEGIDLTLVADQPTHPILDGVASFDGGSSSFHELVTTTSGATLVAHWTDGQPLVATKQLTSGRVVALNFYPPSSNARSDFWNIGTQGGLLMANALLWAGGGAPGVVATTNAWNGSDFIGRFGQPNTSTYGQTFIPPAQSSILNSFTIYFTNLLGSVNFQFYIMAWNGAQATGPVLYQSPATNTAGPGWHACTFNVGRLTLTPGASYVAFASATPGFVGQAGTGLPSGYPYTNGCFVYCNNGTNFSLLTNSAWSSFSNMDLAFVADFGQILDCEPPGIYDQPVSQTVAAGASATFNVTAAGSGSLGYLWSRNGVPIAGATASSYTASDVQLSDSGAQFSCLVTNACGETNSAIAVLYVTPPTLVQNGGFELGTLAGWTISGDGGVFVTSEPSYVHSGIYGAELGPVGGLGYISQTIPTTVGQMYQVSCWLHSDGSMPNEFSVLWHGTALYDQVNIGKTGWTNLQFQARASSASTVLSFGFRNDPSYLGLDDIVVTPIALPLIGSVSFANHAISLSWNTQAGQLYQVQSTTNLTGNHWTNFSSVLPGVNNSMTFTDVTTNVQRFYRIVVLP